MRQAAKKNYPFIHEPYTLCALCVLRGEFLQWTQIFLLEIVALRPIIRIVLFGRKAVIRLDIT
jgi:hypothetical protein